MPVLAPADVYSALVQAGFSPSAAVTMTAISGGESSWRTDAVGDVSLEDATWGPSYGLFQIRTQKGQTGRGTDRDINWLTGSVSHQAKAAYDISNHGTDFSPWTVYNTGAYRQYLAQASNAAGGVAPGAGGGTRPAGGSTDASLAADTFPTFGPAWLPWNWPADAGNAVLTELRYALTGVRNIAIEGAVLVLALGLVGVGIYRISKGDSRA